MSNVVVPLVLVGVAVMLGLLVPLMTNNFNIPISIAEPKSIVLTCDDGMVQALNSPAKNTVDGTNLDYLVCDFDTTVSETLIWSYVIPETFNDSSTIDVTVNVVTADQTTEACFDISFLGLSDDDVIDSAFSVVTGGCTGTMVVGDFEEATMLAIDSSVHTLTAGQLAFFKLDRDVLADSNSGDVGLINVEVFWR